MTQQLHQNPDTLNSAAITPNASLAVIGGGQLGLMFIRAAQTMGYHTLVLDPIANSLAGKLSHKHIQTDYEDPKGLQQLALLAQGVTTEFENVPASALQKLSQHVLVAPPALAAAIAQDRMVEKLHFLQHKIPCAPFAAIERQEQLNDVADHLFPGILKTAREGYDGKGQCVVHSKADLQHAWLSLHQVRCVLEKRLTLAYECSVIIARSRDGTVVHLPVQRNIHHNGILATTIVLPDNINSEVRNQLLLSASQIASSLEYVGVLCVEFFVLEDGQIVANEIAPRPHNSGHYSIDACDVSQFDLQVRTLANLPLTQPRWHSPAIMLNLLGDLWFSDTNPESQEPDWSEILQWPGVHLHLYGKDAIRKGRKMGHITITAETSEQVKNTAAKVATKLGLPVDFN